MELFFYLKCSQLLCHCKKHTSFTKINADFGNNKNEMNHCVMFVLEFIFFLINFQSDVLSYFPSGQEDSLMYTPNSTFNDKLIECLRHKLQIIEESKFRNRTVSPLYEL